MVLAKAAVLELVHELPEQFEAEELQYRLYLQQKIEAAEAEVRDGDCLSHEEVLRETSAWLEG